MTIDEYVDAVVAQAPPLNADQVAALRRLLAPAPIDATTPPAAPRRAPARPHADVATRAA